MLKFITNLSNWVFVLFFLGSASATALTLRGESIDLQSVAGPFSSPVDIQFFEKWMLVVEKGGQIIAIDFGPERQRALLKTPVRTISEMGLLGLALHPQFKTNRLFYTNSNPMSGSLRTQITEWKASSTDLSVATAEKSRLILEFSQPYSNHNGGQIAFGPDGYLYIAVGDGGSANDPLGAGQDLDTLLGKILRIDVDKKDPGKPYAIPKDNPFPGQKGRRPEIYAWGLRNPWRFSFDPQGRLLVGDVGQNRFEEITRVSKGQNHGWKVLEAAHCFEPARDCATKGMTAPLAEYGREQGVSVTGGYLWTDAQGSTLNGHYLFGDFGSGQIWALTPQQLKGDQLVQSGSFRSLGRFDLAVSTFGRDLQGRIYLADYSQGRIYRIVPHPKK